MQNSILLLSFLDPNNEKLDYNSYYTLFIRAYVTDDLYTSTNWYPVVQTLPDKNDTNGGGLGKLLLLS